MANPLLDFLDRMHIAMEADDITQQTQNEVRTAIGGAVPTTTQDENNDENLMQVDNIFSDPPQEDGPSGNPEQDVQGGAEGLPDDGTGEAPTDEGNPEEGGDENTAQDPNLTGDQTDPGVDNQSEEDLLFAKKNHIRDNLIQLYTIISSDIEILVSCITSINDRSTIQIVNSVLTHLRNSKNFLYKTLTENLAELEYDELLQRYVTIRRVYDICIEMLRKYFETNADFKKIFDK